jgi:hypothetical protein
MVYKPALANEVLHDAVPLLIAVAAQPVMVTELLLKATVPVSAVGGVNVLMSVVVGPATMVVLGALSPAADVNVSCTEYLIAVVLVTAEGAKFSRITSVVLIPVPPALTWKTT